MAELIDFKFLFDQAVQKIRSVRAPHATKLETADLKWNVVEQQVLFDFGHSELDKYNNVVKAAKMISISCLQAIIMHCLNNSHWSYEPVDVDLRDSKQSKVLFAIKDNDSSTLFLFKEIEECSYWKMKGCEPEPINEVLRKNKATSCKYIYLMLDYAYLQVIGHNDDETDPGRGYNLYSITWFIEQYFGKENAEHFEFCLKEYTAEVNNCLGYIFLKSLTPNALINFRRITDNELTSFHYRNNLPDSYKDFTLDNQFESLRQQYIDQKYYSIMLGTSDFAESLITAEWLFMSMKKAQAVDLTTIGMGYFKAVEQLLFSLMCLHKNENRQVRKDFSRKDLPPTIELNDNSIQEELMDTSIGSMANFYKNNLDMFRGNLPFQAKKYIRETIFAYKDLRNGYFHKHNIHDWEKIEEIRNRSYALIFLLLGAFSLSEENLRTLGMPAAEPFSDYYRLCEYVNYHQGEIFFFNLPYEENRICFACSDPQSKLVDDSYIQYSGVYFKELGKGGRIFLLQEEHMPKEIHLGKFVFAQKGGVDVTPVRVRKVFENGRFIGPSISEEEQLDY